MNEALARSTLAVALTLIAGCASSAVHVTAGSCPPPVGVCGVIFCADGAGGWCGTTRALQEAVAREGKPLYVEMVPWSHGFRRVAADHFDQRNIDEQACRLAHRVRAWQTQYPGQPVYLVGHSAGSAVVLEAACKLGPNSLERIVLMAPSVSTDYDLRPALGAARKGIDAFISRRDWVALGLAVRLFGTTDRRWTGAAGRWGFRPVGNTPCDAALYGKLRQHPWDCCVAWTGNEGGHYGAYEPGFLHAYVLPLLTPPPGTAVCYPPAGPSGPGNQAVSVSSRAASSRSRTASSARPSVSSTSARRR